MNQELIKDLQTAKRQTWEERERLSEHYDEERRITLANKVTFELNHYSRITHDWCTVKLFRSLFQLLDLPDFSFHEELPCLGFETLSCKVNLPLHLGRLQKKRTISW